MMVVSYVVVAIVWGLVVTQLAWRLARREFSYLHDSTHPDGGDAALGVLYGFMWPLTIPAFVAIGGFWQASRWLSTLSRDKASHD